MTGSDPLSGWDPGGTGTSTTGAGHADPLSGWSPSSSAAPADGSNVPVQASSVGGASKGGKGVGHWLLNNVIERGANIVKGVPAGVAKIGEDLGTSAYRAAEVPFGAGPAVSDQEKQMNPVSGFAHYATREFPILSDVAGPTVGAGRTVGGIAQDLGAPGHGLADEMQHRYGQDPLGSALSDALGTTVVAAPVSGALEKAGLGDTLAGRIAAGTAAATGGVAASPLKPYTALLRGVDLPVTAGMAGRLGDLASTDAAGRSTVHVPGLGDTAPGKAVEAKASQALANSRLGQKASAFAEQNLRSEDLRQKDATFKALTPLRSLSPDEQGAVTAILQGEVRQAAPGLAQLSPEDRAALFARSFPQDEVAPGVRLSPAAAEMALQHELGTLPAEQAARLDKATAAVQGLSATREGKALAGYGTLHGQRVLTPDHLVPEPLERGVLADTAKPQAAVDQATKLEGRLAQRAARSALAAQQTEDVRLGQNPTANVEERAIVNQRAQERAGKATGAGTGAEMTLGQRAQDAEILRAQKEAGIPTTPLERRSAQIAAKLGELRGEPPVEQQMPRTLALTPNQSGGFFVKDTDPLHAFNRAVSEAQRHVIDALHTDAAAGQRGAGFDALSPQERHIYRMVVGEDFAHAKAGELEAARQKLLTTVEEKSRKAGTTEGIRQGVAKRDQQLLDRATKVRESAEGRLAKAQADAREAVHNSPAKFRPMREASAQFVEQLHGMAQDAETSGDHNGAKMLADVASSIPSSLADIAERNLQATHLIGTGPEGISARGERTPLSSNRATLRRTGGEHVREGTLTERTVPGLARLELRRISEQSRNEFTRLGKDTFADTADKVLGNTTGMRPVEIAKAMRDQPEHYIAWNPGQLLGDTVKDEQVTAKTVFLPKAVYDVFRRYDPVIDGALVRGYDRFVKLTYKDRLMLSPAFLFRRAMSNVILMRASDVPLHDMPALGVKAVQMIRDGSAFRENLRGGLFDQERGLVENLPDEGPKGVRGALRHPIKTGYRASQWIDDASRVATSLSRIKEGMEPTAAVSDANRVLGMYHDLSPLERDVVRRVFPIYPWAKQVARVAATMAEEHPLRTMVILHLGQMAADDAKQNPAWMQGMIPLPGGRFLSSRNLDPFSIFTETPGSFLNPVIRSGMEVGAGLNPSNMHELTRPPSEPQHGAITNPRELAYIAQHLDPAARAFAPLVEKGAHALLGTPDLSAPVARYGTGEPRFKKGKTEPDTATPSPVETLTGIPTPRKIDLASIAKRSAKTAKTQDKAGRKYLTQLHKSGD